jgi:hypothetical protein
MFATIPMLDDVDQVLHFRSYQEPRKHDRYTADCDSDRKAIRFGLPIMNQGMDSLSATWFGQTQCFQITVPHRR